ncbi:APA family basic amino acid/polyamine antiporter [Kibdelosporangium banguiense]|uniref:APA family basic amino acid/polyamine antiporter n=1 Tax=Kibdelosporangium banguiense TaxID=1365924 RepID=A0ABS4TBL7_9PSEU|nr:APA family basic amino acid/polyamine antiporter [Kibdelosporangium banguiense]
MRERLVRQLGLVDATTIGLGSMLGAGVFVAFAPAAAAAGSGLLAALVVAAFVAYCNASSSARLAARYPESGGTYVYGREQLGEWWGFAAGWGFVVGKIASCAAMALVFASYVAPGYEKLVAVGAVVVLTTVNYRGITRTAALTRVLLAIVIVVLTTVVVLGLPSAHWRPVAWDAGGILQAAGLLFFAFAGYARIATMGEEVRDPRRTIPRAILAALAAAVLIYLVIGGTVLGVLGPERLALSSAPLADMLAQTGNPSVIARVGAAAASLGALLALIAGVGRTSLAMARNRDLPSVFAAVHPRFSVPHKAEIAVGVVVCGLVLAFDVRGAIGFSSFGVLVYYAIANASAFRMDRSWVAVAGFAGCVALVAFLPLSSVLIGLGVFAAGLLGRLALRR